MDYLVYIIYSSKLNKYYVGHSDNMDRRLIEHNTGLSRFTSAGGVWILKYTESFSTRLEAIARERAIKARKSRRYIETLINSVG